MNVTVKLILFSIMLAGCGSPFETADQSPKTHGTAPGDETTQVGDDAQGQDAADGGATDEPDSNPTTADSGTDSVAPVPDSGADSATDSPVSVGNDADVSDHITVKSGSCDPGAVGVVLYDAVNNYLFGTTGTVCFIYQGAVGGWSVASANGRSVTVQGSTLYTLTTITEDAMQPPMSPGADGYIYWNFSAGKYASASISLE